MLNDKFLKRRRHLLALSARTVSLKLKADSAIPFVAKLNVDTQLVSNVIIRDALESFTAINKVDAYKNTEDEAYLEIMQLMNIVKLIGDDIDVLTLENTEEITNIIYPKVDSALVGFTGTKITIDTIRYQSIEIYAVGPIMGEARIEISTDKLAHVISAGIIMPCIGKIQINNYYPLLVSSHKNEALNLVDSVNILLGRVASVEFELYNSLVNLVSNITLGQFNVDVSDQSNIKILAVVNFVQDDVTINILSDDHLCHIVVRDTNNLGVSRAVIHTNDQLVEVKPIVNDPVAIDDNVNVMTSGYYNHTGAIDLKLPTTSLVEISQWNYPYINKDDIFVIIQAHESTYDKDNDKLLII